MKHNLTMKANAILIPAIALSMLVGCQSKSAVKDSMADVEISSIEFPSGNTGDPESFVDSISYIPLKESDEALLSNVSKLLAYGGHYYILDRLGENILTEFDGDGSFIRQIGSRGESGEEYRKAWDFDVDSLGVCIYDVGADKILSYASDGTFTGSRPVEGRLTGFARLGNGGYILAMAKDGDAATHEIRVVNPEMKEVASYIPFESDFADDRMSDNTFRKTGGTICYNRPVNDSIYVFDRNGELSEIVDFGFKGKRVPAELRKSYERFIEEKGKEKYDFAYDAPMYDGEYLICPSFINGSKGTAIHRKSDGATYVKELNPMKDPSIRLSDIILPIYYDDGKLMTVLDQSITSVLEDADRIPVPVRRQLEEGDKVLCIYHLR